MSSGKILTYLKFINAPNKTRQYADLFVKNNDWLTCL
jgi:hypothetical protein